MKVYLTSDLHLGVNPRGDESVRGIARFLERQATPEDVLIIAGDIATDDEHVTECLQTFARFPGKKAAIAGNHDVWVKPNTISSWERYQSLSWRMRQAGFHPLEDAPFIQGEVGFAGAMGWYDYSFRYRRLKLSMETYVEKMGWSDQLYVRWDFTDHEMVEEQLHRLEAQLQELKDQTSHVIAVLHHVPTAQLLAYPRMRWLVPLRWRYSNAFLGSERFQELLQQYRNLVKTVVCGHIHLGNSAKINGQKFVSIGSTYADKQLLVMEGGKIRRVQFTA